MQLAVIGKYGLTEYKELQIEPHEEKTDKNGTVIFPFKHTKVHSDPWRARDHARFVPQKPKKETKPSS